MKKKEPSCGIYCIQNKVNKKRYIGQSVTIEKRMNRHKLELNKGVCPNPYLQRSWYKHGENNFSFKIIEICKVEELDEKEIGYIKKYNSNVKDGKGYNISWGGNAPMKGADITEEHRKKLSIANSGENNAMWGKKLTKEHLEKMSKALKGKKHSEEANMKAALSSAGRLVKNKSTSQYRGVCQDECGNFIARIANIYLKKRIYIGYFYDEIMAAKEFDKICWELYEDTSKLNFPEDYL
jgi:group I intron endonuclease